MAGHICIGAADNCYNLYDSYGEICVHCNCCGRIDPKTEYQCRLALNERMLEEQINFSEWDDIAEWRKRQEENNKANIAYFKKRIRNIKRTIARRELRKEQSHE